MPIKFAGKLNAFSRGPRGFFVKLEIGADDDWEDLAKSPLGMTFGVVMVPIDPETGRVPEASPGAAPISTAAVVPTGQQRGEAGKPQAEIDETNALARRKLHWNEMSRAQQAGILCQDQTFKLWLSNAYPNTANMVDCADAVRLLCDVSSRSELNEDRMAGKKWDQLVTDFYQATGRMAEAR